MSEYQFTFGIFLQMITTVRNMVLIGLPPLDIIFSFIAIVMATSLHKDCRSCDFADVEKSMAQNNLSHPTDSSDIRELNNTVTNLTEIKTKLFSKYLLKCSITQI